MFRGGLPDEGIQPQPVHAARARAGEQQQRYGDGGRGEERQVRHEGGSCGEPYYPALPLRAEAPYAQQVAGDEPDGKRGQPPSDQRGGAVLASDVRSGEGFGGNREHGDKPAQEQQAAERHVREHVPDAAQRVTQQRSPVGCAGDGVLAQPEPRQRSGGDQRGAADEEGAARREGDEQQAANRVAPDLCHLCGDPDQGASGHVGGGRHD